MSSNQKQGSHGLSWEEIEEAGYKSRADIPHEMISGSVDQTYQLRKVDRNLVHVRLEKKLFDQGTGRKISKPYVQMYNSRHFKRMMDSNHFFGYSLEILHDPDKVAMDAAAKKFNSLKEEREQVIKNQPTSGTLNKNLPNQGKPDTKAGEPKQEPKQDK